MALTNTEKKLLGDVESGVNGSRDTSQYLHSLFFSGGNTIANLQYVSDIPYKGHVENIAVRNWNYEKFQILQGVSSARYPPTAHIMELKSGITAVIMKLEGGNKDYDLILEVPEAREIVLPEKYRFFHTKELDDMGHFDYVWKDRMGLQDLYPSREKGEVKWHVGDTFHGGYTLPEDITFLRDFLRALKKIKPPTPKQLKYIRDINTPG